MPDLKYGLGTIDRDRGNLPKIPVVNFFVEKNDAEPNPILQSRPGLANSATVLGDGPVEALLQVDGILTGQMLAISTVGGQRKLYSAGSAIGVIPGTGTPKLTGFGNRVFVAAGTTLWQYDGTIYSSVATPGSFNVRSMCVGTDRLIVVDDTTGHFYWSNVLSPTIDALSFATAEQSPDNLLDCLFIGDNLLLFGSKTVEFWPASTADPNLPFTPLVGRTMQTGIRATGCATLFNGSFAWISDHNRVCVGNPTNVDWSTQNNVASTTSLEEKLAKSTTAKLWNFWLEGTEFLAVRTDTQTWVFNPNSSEWSTFESYGQANWVPMCYASNYFGSSIDGHLVQWSSDYTDFSGPLERRFRAGLPLNSSTVPAYNVVLRTNPGQTSYLTGTYATPTVELRLSRDGGYEWSAWKARSLGIAGDYKNSVAWRSLGYFGFPAAMFEIRVTDPVPFRVSGVSMNEGYASIGEEG